MKITEVRIFPTESRDGKLKAFATMTFDDWFVVRNVKIIQGNNGLFVAMPSRKAMDSCPKCRFKNVRGSKFCNQCGAHIEQPVNPDGAADEKQGNHMDIAHPISQECRVYIQEEILKAYEKDQGSGRAEPPKEAPTVVEKPAVEEKSTVEETPPAEEKPIEKEEPKPESVTPQEGRIGAEEAADGKDIEL